MGYSSWNDCASQITEERIKNVTRTMISSGLAAKGYIHINVDEGWLKGRHPNGSMYEDRVKFPSGMKALGDWVRDQEVPGKGKIMKYGLYTCRGTCQCGTQLYSGPGGHGYEKEDTAWLANAGADYLKVDSCCGDQDHATAFSDYGKWRDGLNATGRDVYFSLCGWNTWYAPVGDSLGNSWRIAGDGTNWGALSNCINQNSQLQMYARPGAWNDPDLLQGTGKGSNDLKTNPSGCYDPATMRQTQGWYQSTAQAKAQFTMWAMMAAPLLIAADPGQVEPVMLEQWGNEEIISVSQTFREGGPYQGARLEGGDLSFHESISHGKPKLQGSGHNIWGKLLPNGAFALAFLSNENAPLDMTCNSTCFDKIFAGGVWPPALPAGTATKVAALAAAPASLAVRDLWMHADMPPLKPPYSLTAKAVPAFGGVAIYRLTPGTE